MLWAIDKKVVRYVLEHSGLLVEIPIRVTFEYAIEDGLLVDDTLTLNTLFNEQAVLKQFPDLDKDDLMKDISVSMHQEIHEHLALSGYTRGRES